MGFLFIYLCIYLFFYLFRVGLGFELRALHLQRRCSTTWAAPPAHFPLASLEMGVWWTVRLVSSSHVARITGVSQQLISWPFLWFLWLHLYIIKPVLASLGDGSLVVSFDKVWVHQLCSVSILLCFCVPWMSTLSFQSACHFQPGKRKGKPAQIGLVWVCTWQGLQWFNHFVYVT
jgi:hypothetical protein